MSTIRSFGEATRPIYWNIGHIWLMYVLFVVASAVFLFGIWRRVRVWRALGKPARLQGRMRDRIIYFWTFAGAHRRLLRDRTAGMMHMAIMWSMILLFIGTLIVMLKEHLGLPVMQGLFYLVYQKLILSLAGLFLAVGLTVAIVRRYATRVKRLSVSRKGHASSLDDALSLGLPLLILLQGFELQAIRLAATQDPFSIWSPIGFALSTALTGLSEQRLVLAYQVSWWVHLCTVLAWIAWLPYSKMIHMFFAPANIFLGNIVRQPRRPAPIDFDNVEHLGVSKLTDLSWKDMLDLDACIACGRCEAVCPAHASGAPLSPRNLILDARDHMRAEGPGLIADPSRIGHFPLLAGEVISQETLWSCLTCGACVEECPVHIEQVPKISEMRRFLTMEQGDIPETLQAALKSLEDRGHPYQAVRQTRTDWANGLNLIDASGDADFDVLYWVGCTAAFDPRAQKVARSFVELMQMADMKVAILGEQETCCGDPARRMGHEFLYEMFAKGNVEQLNDVAPKKIVTACPHCFNALGNEYRDFGGDYTVMHHTQLLKELVEAGRIKTSPDVKKQVTYHDPCYLGRYNREFDAPRDAIHSAGGEIVEMERSRSKSFCCGGGGGHAFMAASGDGPRVNQLRAEEAAGTGADFLATSCPFCLRMMEDGVGALPEKDKLVVRDVAELLLEAATDTAPVEDLTATEDLPSPLDQA